VAVARLTRGELNRSSASCKPAVLPSCAVTASCRNGTVRIVSLDLTFPYTVHCDRGGKRVHLEILVDVYVLTPGIGKSG
jgi:hypothetical protein